MHRVQPDILPWLEPSSANHRLNHWEMVSCVPAVRWVENKTVQGALLFSTFVAIGKSLNNHDSKLIMTLIPFPVFEWSWM